MCAGYFAWTAEISLDMGWEYAAPDTARWFAILFYLLILEATRRTGGLPLFLIVLAFSLYPTFADKMPDPLSGFQSPFWIWRLIISSPPKAPSAFRCVPSAIW